ncbi:MAG: bacterioferritin [Rikenellaceae bacterium]|nr:bacterioferritin [Rikenellaceae bacterium]
MNKYQTSIELLNKAVGLEIATSMQYMYFHIHCEDMGYKYLAKMFRQTSIQEMRHIEEFSERILYLQGDVDFNVPFRIEHIQDVEQMLSLAIRLEEQTIDDYNAWARACSEASDAATHHLFEEVIAEEEGHLDHFRTEFDNLKAYGMNYLALQSIAQSKSATDAGMSDWEKDEE